MTQWIRAAAAGVFAAAVWLAVEPLIRRVTGIPFGDVRLVGRLVQPNGRWREIGTVTHLVNGAAFGTVFAALGGHGPRRGLVAAQAENAVTWPGMALLTRVHPDTRDGTWPPLATSPRIIAHELITHAVFGLVLGALVPKRPTRPNP
jgi:hypothetical protein